MSKNVLQCTTTHCVIEIIGLLWINANSYHKYDDSEHMENTHIKYHGGRSIWIQRHRCFYDLQLDLTELEDLTHEDSNSFYVLSLNIEY